jgi:hypothetical protein
VIGQSNPLMKAVEKDRTDDADYSETIFGKKSPALQEVTKVSIVERQLKYKQESKKKMKMNKISLGEIDSLVTVLLEVIDDLEKHDIDKDLSVNLIGENQEEHSSATNQYEFSELIVRCFFQFLLVIFFLDDVCRGTRHDISNCLKRWLGKRTFYTYRGRK